MIPAIARLEKRVIKRNNPAHINRLVFILFLLNFDAAKLQHLYYIPVSSILRYVERNVALLLQVLLHSIFSLKKMKLWGINNCYEDE